MFADEMDILSLLQWRAACRLNYVNGVGSLRRFLAQVIGRFFTHPSSVLPLLSQSRAVVGGVAAIGFVLRDHSVVSDTLQIYTTGMWYRRLLDLLAQSTKASSDITAKWSPPPSSKPCC